MIRVIFAFLLINSYLFAAPNWFKNREFNDSNSQIFFGYGEAQNSADALYQAKLDIAAQLKTRVASSFSKIQKDDGTNYSNLTVITTEADVKADIVDVEIVKQEKIDNNFYVVLKYENIKAINKFANKLPKDFVSEAPNNYFSKTLLYKDLKNVIKKDIDIKLARENELWYLQYKNILQVLDKNSFEELFTTINSPYLSTSIISQKPILYDGDTFSFKVKSKEDGYISILEVDEEGSVAVLLNNKKVSKDNTLQYPDVYDKYDLEIATLEENIDSFSVFVVVFSKDYDSFINNFSSVSYSINQSENSKKFNRLIDYLNGKKFTATRVDIRANRN